MQTALAYVALTVRNGEKRTSAALIASLTATWSIQNVPHPSREVGIAEGFCEQVHTRIEPAVMNDRIAGVTGCKQRVDVRLQLGCFPGQFSPRHAARQDNVCKQQIHWSVGFKQRKVRAPIGTLQHNVADLTQQLRGIGSHVFIIFAHENRFAALSLSSTHHGFISLVIERTEKPWQVHLHRRTLAEL